MHMNVPRKPSMQGLMVKRMMRYIVKKVASDEGQLGDDNVVIYHDMYLDYPYKRTNVFHTYVKVGDQSSKVIIDGHKQNKI